MKFSRSFALLPAASPTSSIARATARTRASSTTRSLAAAFPVSPRSPIPPAAFCVAGNSSLLMTDARPRVAFSTSSSRSSTNERPRPHFSVAKLRRRVPSSNSFWVSARSPSSEFKSPRKSNASLTPFANFTKASAISPMSGRASFISSINTGRICSPSSISRLLRSVLKISSCRENDSFIVSTAAAVAPALSPNCPSRFPARAALSPVRAKMPCMPSARPVNLISGVPVASAASRTNWKAPCNPKALIAAAPVLKPRSSSAFAIGGVRRSNDRIAARTCVNASAVGAP